MGLCSSKDAVVIEGKAGNDALVEQTTKPAPLVESAGERDGDGKEAAELVSTRSDRFDLPLGHFRSFCYLFVRLDRCQSLDEHP
jgi:hypothetical protein